MVVVSYSGKEINAKIVYYGPGLCGKTTNLEKIYETVPVAHKGKMISMKTKADRTLFFDFLPIDLGDISGFRTRFMLYTVPGQVYYNATRKLVLKGVDAVVFVADSERGKMRENQESLQNLRDNLTGYGIDVDTLPIVFQYNKRDLPDVYTVEEMDQGLSVGQRPRLEAVAAQGVGVLETLREVSGLLLRKLREELGDNRAQSREMPAALAGPEVSSTGAVSGMSVTPSPALGRPEAMPESLTSSPTTPASSPAAPASQPTAPVGRASYPLDGDAAEDGDPASGPAPAFGDTPFEVAPNVRQAPEPPTPPAVTPPAIQPAPPMTATPPAAGPADPYTRDVSPKATPHDPAEPLQMVHSQEVVRTERVVVPLAIDASQLVNGQTVEIVLQVRAESQRRAG